ncbi:EF-hand domain-containing protein [Uliginosibacterium gangwonense]|uniref:EF-hand domain-containing protein n=1 Tax=Uliginosibacterium gangwonense TaxID=392736 RepID=UPI00038132B6|nr:EF-hand domain-containing protein [Uliginosibacterium gangwonense]
MSTLSSLQSTSSLLLILQESKKKTNVSDLAEQLFSSLDTTGQGYISESDLTSALSSISDSGSSSSPSDAKALFSAMDSNNDGKVTERELKTTLQTVADQIDSQFNALRMQVGMSSAPPADDTGFTKDELSSQLNEIGGSDSKRSTFISNVINNFDKADTNGDGKVSFQESMAYNKSLETHSTSNSDSTSSNSLNASLVQQVMDLVRTYATNEDAITSSSLSISA